MQNSALRLSAITIVGAVAITVGAAIAVMRGDGDAGDEFVPGFRLGRDYFASEPLDLSGFKSSCDAEFELLEHPSPDRVFHTGELMAATVKYEATPECTHLHATFGVRHVQGSPRAEYYCRGGCPQGFSGNIFSESIAITAQSGTVTLVAKPGVFPPAELASQPDLEGAQVCSIGVGVSDAAGRSQLFSSYQFDIGCGREPSPLRSKDDKRFPF